MIDVKALTESLFRQVHAYVSPALQTLQRQVVELGAKLEKVSIQKGDPGERGDPGPVGKSAYELAVERGFVGPELQWLDSLQGKDADPEVIRAEIARAVDAIPRPRDGADADPEKVSAEVARAVAALPKAQDGASFTLHDAQPVIDAALSAAVRALPVPADGKDADPEVIAQAVADGIAKALPEAIQRAVDVLMPELIAKAAAAVPVPKDGKDADSEAILMTLRADTQRALSEWPRPRDGKDADPAVIIRAAKEAAEALPKPADGKSVTIEDVEPMLERLVDEAVRALPAPRDGRDVEPETVRTLVDEAVAAAVAVIPRPRDGASAEDLRPMVEESVARAAAALPKPKDGVDGKSPDEAEIVARLDAKFDRVVESLPKPANGRDGKDAPEVDLDALASRVRSMVPTPRDGEDGRSVTVDDVRPVLEAEVAKVALELERRISDATQRAVDQMPRPKDADHEAIAASVLACLPEVKDGRDGMSLDDFEVALNDRTFTFSLRCGDRVVTKEIKVPFPVDKGVYRSGAAYEQGDVVTFGGSQWIARKDTNTKPPSDDWRCQVRRGTDGKDAQ